MSARRIFFWFEKRMSATVAKKATKAPLEKLRTCPKSSTRNEKAERSFFLIVSLIEKK